MAEAKPEAPAFEAALDELEKVVQRLEGGELTLEQTLQLFERGIELRDRCQKELKDAETRIEILMRRGDEIRPEPFQPEQ
jgi:exodeoxyribonuclease VII small subunit